MKTVSVDTGTGFDHKELLKFNPIDLSSAQLLPKFIVCVCLVDV